MPPVYTLPLADPQARLTLVGGKGASLARLAAAGLPVPGGFHITTWAYRSFVAANGLQEQILEIVAPLVFEQPAELEEASRRIAGLFARSALPEEISEAVRGAYARLGGRDLPVAVRSSATAEDLPELSFAGQQDTFLNVRGENALLDAVRRCWASLWTARAIDYRLRNRVASADVSLAVVIQELVAADASGIMFTADPLTGMFDRVVINAAWGLGEAVVGGLVTPDTLLVDKISGRVLEQRINTKDNMTVLSPLGTHESPVPAERRNQAVLSPARAATLARLGMKIELIFKQPVDVEWAIAHGRIFILQARPITTLRGHNPAAGEWNDSLAGDFLWTRGNYGEAVPDVMTPCTWSLVQVLIDNADPSYGPYPYGNLAGRLYKNLSEAASLAAAFGINPQRFARIIEAGFGRLPAGLEIPVVHLSRWRLFRRVLPVVIRQLSSSRANLKRLPAFLAQAPARCEALKERVQAVDDSSELVALWGAEIAPFFIECCRMVQASANQGGAAILTIPRNLKKLVGEQDANALLTGSGGASDPLASLGPLLGLTQLARGEIDLASFTTQFGHRGPHEAEISTPRPAEDPDWINQQLAGLGEAHADAAMLMARQEAARAAAWEHIHRNFPQKERKTGRQVERWIRIAHEREAARSELIRSLWLLRNFVLRAGALTGQNESVFFLSIDEILALLGGDKACLAHIHARRLAYQQYCSLPPTPVLVRGQFDPFLWAADPHRRTDLYIAQGGGQPANASIIGFPGAAGVVEGRVRVLAAVEEGSQLQNGEVLVTSVTNVGWTPLFPRLAAVVTDVGAPLSHAAIVARELGIPAVVGCGNATLCLHTGDRVRVDGGQGTVVVLADANDLLVEKKTGKKG